METEKKTFELLGRQPVKELLPEEFAKLSDNDKARVQQEILDDFARDMDEIGRLMETGIYQPNIMGIFREISEGKKTVFDIDDIHELRIRNYEKYSQMPLEDARKIRREKSDRVEREIERLRQEQQTRLSAQQSQSATDVV
ncbi:MAG: hypothetical protein LBN42_03050 [Oscillospiraceae bacterium]|jgi:hypothetical protein|nr:hypothetical protein [Oscillospiraceae bacterium]